MASIIEDAVGASASVVLPHHPYSPVGVGIPSYVANTLSTPAILAIFCSACSVVLLPALRYIRQARPDLPKTDVATFMWFLLCAGIHMVLEGYFAFNFRDVAGHSTVLGQLWKEYSLSDSRYLTQDAFISCMEAVTAIFWGPLSVAIAYCIANDHPLRYPLQLIVSLGQLYGDVLYYSTFQFSTSVWGVDYCRPETKYFYFYYVMMNAFWIVIPFCLIVGAVREMVRVFAADKAMREGKKKA